MLYRENPKNGDRLSQLGFGCMRFPRKGTSIDIARSADMVHSAIEKGVNYFDTAYIYPGSEAALGKILAGEWRPKVKIATKLPLFLCRTPADLDKYFNLSLERLQTETIDYYLLHMLPDMETFRKFQTFGIEDWAEAQKKRGRIRNIGFSFHGGRDSFKQLIDACDWDFTMIQYNYMDENNQAGKTGLQYAHSKGLPVMVMEPLRGGKLAGNMPEAALREFGAVHPDRSAAEWGLRWVWNHQEVTLLLSGMSTPEQADENIRIASQAAADSLMASELEAVRHAAVILGKATKVPCTGCGYCLPCPSGVDIPTCFSHYNEASFSKKGDAVMKYLQATSFMSAKPAFASQCKKCGKCETHCPQSIRIMDELHNTVGALEPFWVKPAVKVVRRFTRAKK